MKEASVHHGCQVHTCRQTEEDIKTRHPDTLTARLNSYPGPCCLNSVFENSSILNAFISDILHVRLGEVTLVPSPTGSRNGSVTIVSSQKPGSMEAR